ncbi:SusC/RagA family TonB-linked outer membrane protein [Spirosoma taeanense]|uniref:SusC/RagA family TonB-linked outer membrane protein n=1 Tax=Spirosoma taeanense TaxID=2735870 RepID=A0A6M5Y8E2_9BACT|nr:SusC/RagA family TonB-linked outer membrane protein [Spirosoma taeanense]QJW90235.1 SusC/RagA family TonB-linked outer membrane protein [Spirosoma taeanense]
MNRKLLVWLWLFFGLAGTALAQEQAVTGRVTDAQGAPIPGASVALKGRTIGTNTDANGTYRLNVPATGTLVFSFIGFATQEVAIGNRTTINVQLTEGNQQLEEVVVTGLATSVKRSNAANAVSSIGANQISGVTKPQTVDGALNGKLPGVNITANSGAPGGGFSVKLRGISSVTQASEPLYIIDGVYIDNSQFNTGAGTGSFNRATAQTTGTQDQASNRIADINPEDIENIEVLKGPSAAAIYGTRANAGVILITTKRGKNGQTIINFGQDLGFAEVNKFAGMAASPWNAEKINNGVFLISNKAMADLYAAAGGNQARRYDYEREIYGQKGLLRNTKLNVSGGTDRLRYYVNGSVLSEDGVQKYTGFKRNSFRANIDAKLSDFIDISTGSNYVNSSSSRSFSGNDNNGVSLGYNLAYLPPWLEQHQNADGTYPANPITGQNLFQVVDRMRNTEQTNRFIQSMNVNFYLLNEKNHQLKFAVTGGIDYILSEAQAYAPSDMQYFVGAGLGYFGAVRNTTNRSLNTNIQGFLVDNLQLNGDLNFTTSVGTVRLTNSQRQSYIEGRGLKPGPNKNPNTADTRVTDTYYLESQDVGYVAQEEINWKDRIIATGGVRFDKSSLNGDNNKLYTFPKASLAINVANFGFWTSRELVSSLKLRAAYGQTGRSPSFGNTFTSLTNVSIDGKSGVTVPLQLGNATANPETASEIETGVDIGFLNNRLTLEATYYDKRVLNFLYQYQLAPSVGATQINAYPVGDLQNKGIELSLNAQVFKKAGLSWNSTLNYWFNRTKVTRLAVPSFTVPSSGFGGFGTNQILKPRDGQTFSPTAWYGSPYDANGNPTAYNDFQPRFNLSTYNMVTFLNNFTFAFLLHWSYKNYNATLNQELMDEGGTTPDWLNKDNLYQAERVAAGLGDGSAYNGVARIAGSPGVTTRQFVQDASYVKLRELSLYYTVPRASFNKLFGNTVKGIRLGVSGNNVFVWTKYVGYDPEASQFGNRPIGAGVDLLSFPASRRLFFHLNFTF